AVEDDEGWLVRQDDPRHERGDLADLRAAKPAIEDREAGEVPVERGPEADARAADEEDPVRRGRVRAIRVLERPDRRFPLRQVRRRPGLASDERLNDEKQREGEERETPRSHSLLVL